MQIIIQIIYLVQVIRDVLVLVLIPTLNKVASFNN